MSEIDKNSPEDMLRDFFSNYDTTDNADAEVDEDVADDDLSADEASLPIISLIDDDGNEHYFEELDVLSLNDKEYVALLPVNNDYFVGVGSELLLLIRSYDEEEIYLDPIEDDDEYIRIRNIFEERLADLF